MLAVLLANLSLGDSKVRFDKEPKMGVQTLGHLKEEQQCYLVTTTAIKLELDFPVNFTVTQA